MQHDVGDRRLKNYSAVGHARRFDGTYRRLRGAYVGSAAEGWPERDFRGKDAVRSFYEGFAEAVGRDSVIEVLIDAGDVVVTRVRAHMTGVHSGLEGDFRFSQVTTFRKGKVVLNEFFWDHQEALEAAGLRE
jgi:ketosteroid isomerase-like protein